MSVKTVLRMGDPLLLQKAEVVKQFDAPELHVLIQDLEDTMQYMNGAGIAADKLEQIFQPFYTTKPKGEGTGLGLALSSSIVEKHRGVIEVQSQQGQGSCFKVKIPRSLDVSAVKNYV